MIVFTVTRKVMNGVDCFAVYSNKKSAEKYLQDHEKDTDFDIIETRVTGDLKKDGTVFSASYYEKNHDTHIFKDIYGSYDQAKNAAGEKGQILDIKILD